jgi:hypothetical protein
MGVAYQVGENGLPAFNGDRYFVFTSPVTMRLGRRTQVTAVLSENAELAIYVLEAAFDGGIEGRVMTATAQVAEHMLAKLHGKSFHVEAVTPEKRAMYPARAIEWTWYVEPIEQGAGKLLRLELFALIRGAPPIRVGTFDTRADIGVERWDWVLLWMRELQPVAGALTALGAIVTVLATAWALYRRLNKILAAVRLRRTMRAAPAPSDWAGFG